jgi:hypothetical protein
MPMAMAKPVVSPPPAKAPVMASAAITLTAETQVPSERSKPRVMITIICAEAKTTR